MAQNFLTCDRDQPMLLPPDLRDWLSDDHLAWFVIDAVTELDLEPFYASYRNEPPAPVARPTTSRTTSAAPRAISDIRLAMAPPFGTAKGDERDDRDPHVRICQLGTRSNLSIDFVPRWFR